MVTLKYQDCGSKLCVYIDGDTQADVQDTFNSFWNHMATNGELQKVSEFSGFFWTDRDRLMNALEHRNLFRMMNEADELRDRDVSAWAESCKGIEGGFMPRARELAREQWEAMEVINRPDFKASDEVYSIGSAKGDTLPVE